MAFIGKLCWREWVGKGLHGVFSGASEISKQPTFNRPFPQPGAKKRHLDAQGLGSSGYTDVMLPEAAPQRQIREAFHVVVE